MKRERRDENERGGRGGRMDWIGWGFGLGCEQISDLRNCGRAGGRPSIRRSRVGGKRKGSETAVTDSITKVGWPLALARSLADSAPSLPPPSPQSLNRPYHANPVTAVGRVSGGCFCHPPLSLSLPPSLSLSPAVIADIMLPFQTRLANSRRHRNCARARRGGDGDRFIQKSEAASASSA